ncbi:MAG: DUF502 domain-containing protein [Candidatus Omnitrophica bacterium]|nr:DUF502 domain-containing protein [Candidatus Omnitrophota bacterium]HOX54662.1 DUF502 domain-containing protein [Candidatus Omnitrophota bacterium]
MKKLRGYFITGLAVFLPIAITIYILVVAFRFFDNILGRFINIYLLRTGGIYIPGLGLILFILVVFLTGFFTRHFLGRKIFPFFERIFLLKPPLIRQIYPSVKKIINLVLSQEKPSFKKAVLVEYPRKGIYSLGFVANEGMKEAKDKTNTDDLVNVLIPSSPSPFSGYLIMVPKKELIYLDISIEKAFELIISDGVLNPEDIADKPV